jgi:hypothetical protein
LARPAISRKYEFYDLTIPGETNNPASASYDSTASVTPLANDAVKPPGLLQNSVVPAELYAVPSIYTAYTLPR